MSCWGGSAVLLPTPPRCCPGNLRPLRTALAPPLLPGAVSTLPCSTARPPLPWHCTAVPVVAGTSSLLARAPYQVSSWLSCVCSSWGSTWPLCLATCHGRAGDGGSRSVSAGQVAPCPFLLLPGWIRRLAYVWPPLCRLASPGSCTAVLTLAAPAQLGERGPVGRAQPAGVQQRSGRAVWWAWLAHPANFLLCSLSLSLSICLRGLSAGRGEDAWASSPRLVSTVGPGCARCPECPGRVHAVSLGRAVTSVLPRPSHPYPCTALSE